MKLLDMWIRCRSLLTWCIDGHFVEEPLDTDMNKEIYKWYIGDTIIFIETC